MVLWQGLTEGGTAVPVQVTEDGKVVAQGQQGEKGDKGDKGDPGDPGEFEPGQDAALGRVACGTDIENAQLEVFKAVYNNETGNLFTVGNQGTLSNGGHAVGQGPDISFRLKRSSDGSKKNSAYIRAIAEGNLTTSWPTSLVFGTQRFGDNPVEHLTLASTGDLIGNKWTIGSNGAATFEGDVVIGSRNSQWMIVESGGLAHLIEQTSKNNFSEEDEPREYPVLRDIPAELTMVEEQLQKVMERLKMTPEAGWEVWDGSD